MFTKLLFFSLVITLIAVNLSRCAPKVTTRNVNADSDSDNSERKGFCNIEKNINGPIDFSLLKLWPEILKLGYGNLTLPNIINASVPVLFSTAPTNLTEGILYNISQPVRNGSTVLQFVEKGLRFNVTMDLKRTVFEYKFVSLIPGLFGPTKYEDSVQGIVENTTVRGVFTFNIKKTKLVLNDFVLIKLGKLDVKLRDSVFSSVSSLVLTPISEIMKNEFTGTIIANTKKQMKSLVRLINLTKYPEIIYNSLTGLLEQCKPGIKKIDDWLASFNIPQNIDIFGNHKPGVASESGLVQSWVNAFNNGLKEGFEEGMREKNRIYSNAQRKPVTLKPNTTNLNWQTPYPTKLTTKKPTIWPNYNPNYSYDIKSSNEIYKKFFRNLEKAAIDGYYAGYNEGKKPFQKYPLENQRKP